MDDRILVLWATPRSTSTAFEWMMRRRGDFVCLHEPFGLAYYRGIDRRTTRFDENELEPTRSYATTWRDILDARRDGRVFSKDFPNYVIHLLNRARARDDTGTPSAAEFPDAFQHTFLIRDPAKALVSMYEHWTDFTFDEASFGDLHRTFDAVVERYGTIPPVIDSDDLLDDPDGTVRAYSEAVGIDFLADALQWETGDRREVRWYGGRWHDALSASTGLRRQDRRHAVTVDDVPFLRELERRCRPHYEALAASKLTPIGADPPPERRTDGRLDS